MEGEHMTKSKSSTISAAGIVAVVALCAGFYAVKPVMPAVVNADNDWHELGTEIEHPFGESVVKGAPFSARVTVEHTQTLANGVHVSSKMIGSLYRDGDGRTRNELPREGGPEIAMIEDPGASVLYHLNLFHHTALKVTFSAERDNSELETRERKREMEERHNREIEEREKQQQQVELAGRKVTIERRAIAEPERKIESLGIQSFDGVQAEGKRVTLTVPAGKEGNDQPFEIVSEKWYSPDLKVLIMSKRIDPRIGDSVYRLENINRSEPSHSLFEAPSDFNITEEKTAYRRKERQ
jgi:hypothetical protein